MGVLVLPAMTSRATANRSSGLARAWQSDDGLPDNSVSGIAQTPDGYLWVGTLGGLVRFDGARFQELSPANIPGVPNRVVRALLLDHRGWLWLGMDRGPVVCIEPKSALLFTTKDGLPDLHCSVMVEDGEGAIWIAYVTGAVCRIKDGTVTSFGTGDGLPADGPCRLATDSTGRLWFGKGGRVGVFREERFQTRLSLDEQVVSLGAGRAGGVWICAGPRLFKCHESGALEECAHLPASREGIAPRVLLEDQAGAVWIGTAASGVFRYDGSEVELVNTSHAEIRCLAEDREGNVWAGTGGGGLNRLRPVPLELLGTEAGLPFESVRSVCEDATGTLWMVTQNGLLARREGTRWATVSDRGAPPGEHVLCVAADSSGAVWIGTQDQGLHRFQNGRFSTWGKQDGLASDAVRSLLPSSTGDLWIGTDSPNQVQRLCADTLLTVEMPQPTRSIRAMAEDAAGNIWIGTAEGRLLRTGDRGNRLVNEPAAAQGRLLSIRCLHTTSDGSLWIGYAGAGVGRLKAGQFARIDASRGLYDNYISQMVADGRGRLWFAGNRGIFQVRLQELTDLAENRASHVQSIVYGRGEGLPSLQANFDYYPGALRSRDGSIWFPMRKGLAVIHPDKIRDNPDAPPVLLERVAVDGQTVAMYDSGSPLRPQALEVPADLRALAAPLRVPPDHRKLEFEFTALSLTAPENVHFRYRLEGYEDEWIEALTQRSASYSHLFAGNYRFHVIACNNAGVWNDRGAVLSLIVLPFFWQTWWFRVAAPGAFTLSVIAIVRYVTFRRLRLRMRLLEQQAALHRERARIAKDIHDDLGADLTQISLLGELAQQDRAAPEKAAERIEKISATARGAIKSLDEIVWAVNPRNDTLAHLIDYAGQFALDYLRVAGIRCRLDLPEQTPQREVSTDVRHNLFLVVKEALHNIVKHAHATAVWLRVTATDDALRLVIEDDGRGFEQPPNDAEADGLRNIRQRVSEIGGECRIESQAGAGTKVIVDLAWADR